MAQTREEHKRRHKELHKALDELVADYLRHHEDSFMRETSIMDLVLWSGEQTDNPTEDSDVRARD